MAFATDPGLAGWFPRAAEPQPPPGTGFAAEYRQVGDPGSRLSIEVEVRGEHAPDLPSALPAIVDRVGIDTEPLDLSDPAVRAWLAACIRRKSRRSRGLRGLPRWP